ncbi:MAG: CvpA family protein, partial [Panacagrimonas sp.]
MNWADYGILAIVILSILIGLLRGFTREIFGLGTWILAILLAILFGPDVAQSLQSHVAT